MIAWGGENIDQSLRSWLCGGRIEVAQGAFVAHMWRDPNNPKTRLKTLGWTRFHVFVGLIMGLESGWERTVVVLSSMISSKIASRNGTQKLQTS